MSLCIWAYGYCLPMSHLQAQYSIFCAKELEFHIILMVQTGEGIEGSGHNCDL